MSAVKSWHIFYPILSLKVKTKNTAALQEQQEERYRCKAEQGEKQSAAKQAAQPAAQKIATVHQ